MPLTLSTRERNANLALLGDDELHRIAWRLERTLRALRCAPAAVRAEYEDALATVRQELERRRT